jgi:hypothetical protein
MIVLGYFSLRIFHKYILPLLKSEMDSDRNFLCTLRNQKISLAAKKDLLEKDIQREILEQQILKQKLLYWNSSVDQFKIATAVSQQKLTDKLYERKVAIKNKRLEMELSQTTIDAAMDEAKKTLQFFFKDKEEGVHYIVQLIEQSFIKKGS